MINLTYKDLNNLHFSAGVYALKFHRGLPVKVAYNLAKVSEKIEKETKVFQELRLNLCEKHAEKDEKGAPKKQALPNGQENYVLKDKNAFDHEYQELLAISFEISKEKFKLSELEGAGLSPAELIAIEPLIAEEV